MVYVEVWKGKGGGKNMNKPVVFISHIAEEKELVLKLKELISDKYLGMIEIFVSSDEKSIQAGSRWLDKVTIALQACKVMMILCSPKSVERPWINFEAGAGWVKEIPVIPLCHSGMEIRNLPTPLNLLQACKMADVESFKKIFPILSKALGTTRVPEGDIKDFIDNVIKFEGNYTIYNKFMEKYNQLAELLPDIKDNLYAESIQVLITTMQRERLSNLIDSYFAPEGLLYMKYLDEGLMYSDHIMRHKMQIQVTPKIRELLKNIQTNEEPI